MTTRADSNLEGGLLRPLEQLELEERERVSLAVASLEDEFQREFSAASRKAKPSEACGPLPWTGFLDLSTL